MKIISQKQNKNVIWFVYNTFVFKKIYKLLKHGQGCQCAALYDYFMKEL